ncbi:MAG: hypothetical protein ACE5OQ_14855 [Woeseia sp.]
MRNKRLILSVLSINAVFSAASALLMFAAGGWLAQQLGIDSAVPVYVVAGFLAVFALQLGNIVRIRRIRTWEIAGIISGDIAWVIASHVLAGLYYRSISATGLMFIDIVAVAVLFFAIQQIRGLRAYRRTAGR